MNAGKLILGILLASVFSCACADDFGAMPGLWNTTIRNEADAGKPITDANTHWHCVDEGANPWTAFAEVGMPSGYSCKRSSYERTATSLKWRLDCKGPSKLVSEGSIVFDSAKHYAGKVQLTAAKNGVSKITNSVEGTRVAACTSPAD